MTNALAAITFLVRDYDEAIAFFTGKLGFALIEDSPLGEGKRWVLVAPPHSAGTKLLLAKAVTAEQIARIGDQAGGRVFLFLQTDHFQRDYDDMRSRGVTFLEAPREETYGIVAVFEDLHGNRWDLLQPVRPEKHLGRLLVETSPRGAPIKLPPRGPDGGDPFADTDPPDE